MNEQQQQNDITKAREAQQAAVRILTNALVLMDIGVFPGKHSQGIEEVKQFLAKLQGEALNAATAIQPAPATAPATPPPAAA